MATRFEAAQSDMTGELLGPFGGCQWLRGFIDLPVQFRQVILTVTRPGPNNPRLVSVWKESDPPGGEVQLGKAGTNGTENLLQGGQIFGGNVAQEF